MYHNYFPVRPKGLGDYLRDLCRFYRGELDNPYEVESTVPEIRQVEFLRYNLWDAEASLMQSPAYWKNLLYERGLGYADAESEAKAMYRLAIGEKLSRMGEAGVDYGELYRRLMSAA